MEKMDSESMDDESKREYIHGIILNRGRQVDLHQYLMKHPEELLRGVLIAGSIGSGKTERSISIVRSALDLDYGVLVFDPSNDYQRLLGANQDGVVIDFSEYYMNPLEPPPGLSLEEWSSVFIQVFAQNFGLKDPSIAILQRSLSNLIKSSQNEPPMVSELLEEVAQFQPRTHSSERNSQASVQNRLESVLDSEWSRCLNVRHGFSPTDFEDGLLIVKIRPVGIERVHELVIGLTVAKLFTYRSWKQNLGEPLGKNVLVVIEEAHRFLSEGRQGDRRGQTLYLERALVESRKLGVGFVTVDQMPHRISDYVLGSCNLWVVCKLMDPHSRKMVGEALRTDVIWSHIGLMELPVGGAIIRVENQRELEDTSPMVHRDEKFLYDVTGLPATVALPMHPESLFPSLESEEVRKRMIKNNRYMRYFERVLTQDYLRVRESLQESEKSVLRGFIAQMLGKEPEEPESPDISKYHESPKPMDRIQIEACKRIIGLLSSEVQLKLLELILEYGKVNTSQLAESVSKSPSWISRTIGKMSAAGIVRRQSGFYSLTPKGMKIIRWVQSINQDMTNPNLESGLVEMEVENLRENLSMIKEYRLLREDSTVAGWWGGQESLDEILRIEYLLHYLVEREKIDSTLRANTNIEFFHTLKTSLDSNVLASLLANERPVLLRQFVKNSSIGDRSIRRQLNLLENYGVIERIWHNGQKGAQIRARWRVMLGRLVSEQNYCVTIPLSLLQKSLKLVGNYELHKHLVSGVKKNNVRVKFDRI